MIGCDICGRAAEEGLWNWVSLGGFDMVCDTCALATTAQAPWANELGHAGHRRRLSRAAAAPAVRDSFSQAGWPARAHRLCKRVIRRLGTLRLASRFTEESARGMWLWAAPVGRMHYESNSER